MDSVRDSPVFGAHQHLSEVDAGGVEGHPRLRHASREQKRRRDTVLIDAKLEHRLRGLIRRGHVLEHHLVPFPGSDDAAGRGARKRRLRRRPVDGRRAPFKLVRDVRRVEHHEPPSVAHAEPERRTPPPAWRRPPRPRPAGVRRRRGTRSPAVRSDTKDGSPFPRVEYRAVRTRRRARCPGTRIESRDRSPPPRRGRTEPSPSPSHPRERPPRRVSTQTDPARAIPARRATRRQRRTEASPRRRF